jgi:hypothetical protein
MVGLHPLKCSMIFSYENLCSSRRSMITYGVSRSYFLSQFMFFSFTVGEVGATDLLDSVNLVFQ